MPWATALCDSTFPSLSLTVRNSAVRNCPELSIQRFTEYVTE
jgi:hypothetical protein